MSGIAIAIGVVADVGVVFVESIIRYKEMPENKHIQGDKLLLKMIYASVSEVSVPIATAMITTIVSFIPVFVMQGQEGKLFSPLAYTKTYVLGFAFLIGIVILPTIAYLVFAVKIHSAKMRQIGNWLLVVAGVILAIWFGNIIALGLTVIGVNNLTSHLWKNIQMNTYINLAITLLIAVHFLADEWLPLGPERGFRNNFV